jgi:hypothetical protein
MAKAVVPMSAFREKYGIRDTSEIGPKLQDMVGQFLHEATRQKSDEKEEVRTR